MQIICKYDILIFMKLDYGEILKNSNIRVTSSRVMILENFYKTKKPIRAEDVYLNLKNKLDEATVYRTLSSFEKNKIIRRVNLKKDSAYFELNNDHHHHIVCESCGKIEDFRENVEIEKILKKIVEGSSNFKNINEHSLELFGLCNFCNKS